MTGKDPFIEFMREPGILYNPTDTLLKNSLHHRIKRMFEECKQENNKKPKKASESLESVAVAGNFAGTKVSREVIILNISHTKVLGEGFPP